MLVVDNQDPETSKMFNAFLQRALQGTAHMRFCVTSDGVGLVPDGCLVGDVFVEFGGERFVVRKVGKEERGEGDDGDCWRLVGSGCLLRLGGERGLDEGEERDIVLI